MSIYERTNSKYYWFKFHFDGELVQQSSKCTNKADAKTIESAYRTQLALGKIGIKPKVKAPAFDEAVKDFLKWSKVEHSETESTYNRYFYSCEVLKKHFGKINSDKIKKKHIEDFIIWRSGQKSKKTGKPITRKTLNFDLFILKKIFKRLSQENQISENPTKAIKQLPEQMPPFYVISADEEKHYLLACPQPVQDVAALMIETGMRCGEVYNLKQQEVFLENDFLKVTKGKTPSSIRRVPLSEKAKKILSYRLNKFDGAYLFPQNDIDGNKATRSLCGMHLKAVRMLKYDFRLYDCRHTFASRALESGTDLLTLAALLGHANLKMVSRYAHPSEEMKADAIKRIEIKRKAKAV